MLKIVCRICNYYQNFRKVRRRKSRMFPDPIPSVWYLNYNVSPYLYIYMSP